MEDEISIFGAIKEAFPMLDDAAIQMGCNILESHAEFLMLKDFERGYQDGYFEENEKSLTSMADETLPLLPKLVKWHNQNPYTSFAGLASALNELAMTYPNKCATRGWHDCSKVISQWRRLGKLIFPHPNFKKS